MPASERKKKITSGRLGADAGWVAAENDCTTVWKEERNNQLPPKLLTMRMRTEIIASAARTLSDATIEKMLDVTSQ